MKVNYLFFLSMFTVLFGCSNPEIDFRQTEKVNGLIYKLHDTEPFTGKVLNVTDYSYLSSFGLAFNFNSCNVELKKGVLHGKVECFAGKFQTVWGNYKDGKRHGLQEKAFSQNGQLVSSEEYVNGVLKKAKTFNPNNNKLIYEANWNNASAGEEDGFEKSWDDNGEMLLDLVWKNGKKTGFVVIGGMHKEHYVDGVLDGPFIVYAGLIGSGKIEKEGSFKKGVKDGAWKRYDQFGNLIEEFHYENGVVMSGISQEWELKEQGKLLEKISFIRKNGILVRTGKELKDKGLVKYELDWLDGSNIANGTYINRAISDKDEMLSPEDKREIITDLKIQVSSDALRSITDGKIISGIDASDKVLNAYFLPELEGKIIKVVWENSKPKEVDIELQGNSIMNLKMTNETQEKYPFLMDYLMNYNLDLDTTVSLPLGD